jgi:asparagine synthase (glutamine-hydrolysing)
MKKYCENEIDIPFIAMLIYRYVLNKERTQRNVEAQMSAIAGIWNVNESRDTCEQGEQLRRNLSKCPADCEGVWQEGTMFLTCRSRWINSEAVGVPNPYHDGGRRLTIVADAIIDNRKELLDRLGIQPGQHGEVSDQELILLSYDKWGMDAASKLVGDFAFVLWDERRGRLYGARDFSGGRMLYYHWNGRSFRFSSLIEPLLALEDTSRELNEQWLAQYVAITAVVDVVGMDQTVYRNVKQIPPAHYFLLENGSLTLSRYCRLDSVNKLWLKNDHDYVEAFREVFQEAIDARVRTFRKVGAQLSGGLDSGAVASFAARRLRRDDHSLYTYSYVPVSDFVDYTPRWYAADETPYIAQTVAHIGGIKEHYLAFEGADPYSEIDGMLGIMEMPYKFYINSFWLKGIFEHAERDGVGVLLNGGRGNLSISWGDAIPFYAELMKKMRWGKLMEELALRRYAAGTGRKHLLSLVGRELLTGLSGRKEKTPPYQVIINEGFAAKTGVYEVLRQHGIGEDGWLASTNAYINRSNHFQELYHWNASNTLAAKLSYRYGVWKRDPTNDLRVISFCLSLPEEQYVHKGMSRALVRRATEHMLPDRIRLNETIRGVQGADWLHRVLPRWEQLHGEFRDMLGNGALLEMVDGKVLKAALGELSDGVSPSDAHGRHINALMVSLILHRFLKQAA